MAISGAHPVQSGTSKEHSIFGAHRPTFQEISRGILCASPRGIQNIRHPAVANTRLYRYDGKTVTFWYEDHGGKRNFVTMGVREFIKALIQHIPDRNFKMIRYYGAYSRRTKSRYAGYLQRSIKQSTFEDFITKVNKWAPICPNCGRKMTFAWYEKGPPKETEVFGCKLSDWNHPMLSQSYN